MTRKSRIDKKKIMASARARKAWRTRRRNERKAKTEAKKLLMPNKRALAVLSEVRDLRTAKDKMRTVLTDPTLLYDHTAMHAIGHDSVEDLLRAIRRRFVDKGALTAREAQTDNLLRWAISKMDSNRALEPALRGISVDPDESSSGDTPSDISMFP